MYGRLFVFANISSYFYGIIINIMIVYYSKMTGEELNRIFDVSKMTAPDFAERLGIKKTKLYNQFKQRFIEHEIEQRLIADPELASKRMLLSVPDNKNEQLSEHKTHGPSPELWDKAFKMLNETVRLVSEDNKFIKELANFIKEDATIYRTIVQQGIKQGAIKFTAPKN